MLRFAASTLDQDLHGTHTGWWSYIEAASVMIRDDIFEVKGGAKERRYWVHGIQGLTSRNLDFSIGGFTGRFRVERAPVIQYKILLSNDQVRTVDRLRRGDVV
jgi:hypothetical protein